MEVLLASYAGACYGVKRALDIAFGMAGSDGGVSTLGSLIHNPGVVRELEELGIEKADDIASIATENLIIRSHGVDPGTKDALCELGINVVDATCPHVERAQKAASELAEECTSVLVVGEKGHPEVEGLKAYASLGNASVYVVLDPHEIPDVLGDKVGVVVQTTQTNENFDLIINELKGRGITPKVRDTICAATQKRQKTAAELAQNVDVMIVLGGKNSSNTTRLAEICEKACKNTHHIEDASEIDFAWFNGCETVGVTAGASTPQSQIDTLVELLRKA